MNNKNLVKLSKYILSEVSDEQFDMEFFRSSGEECDVKFYSKEDCGTVGCALGWSPFVKGLEVVEDDFIEIFAGFNRLVFYEYSERVFGIDCSEDCWKFIFHSLWYEIDNTREGFVKRVLYLIEGGNDLERKTCQYKNIDPNKINNY